MIGLVCGESILRLSFDRLRNHIFAITLIRQGHFGHVHYVLLVLLRESLVAVRQAARQVKGPFNLFTRRGHLEHVLLVSFWRMYGGYYVLLGEKLFIWLRLDAPWKSLVLVLWLRRKNKWKLLIFGLNQTSLLLLRQTCRSLILCCSKLLMICKTRLLLFSNAADDGGDEQDNAEEDSYPNLSVCRVLFTATHVQRLVKAVRTTGSLNFDRAEVSPAAILGCVIEWRVTRPIRSFKFCLGISYIFLHAWVLQTLI